MICPNCGATLALHPASLDLVSVPPPVVVVPPPPPPPTIVAQLPNPPTGYIVPTSVQRVATSTDLTVALNSSPGRDIVLAAGTFDGSAPFLNPNGHRLWAESLGAVTLNCGLSLGANSGPGGGSVRGVIFDVSASSKTLQDSVIHIWGAGGARSVVQDCAIGGRNVVGAGILARQVEGLVIQRIAAYQFTSYGIFLDPNVQGLAVAAPPLLEDVDVAAISRPVPRSSNGTAEAGIWLGTKCVARRLRTRDTAWMGLWTGTACQGSLIEHVDVDRVGPNAEGVGIYLEHFTTACTFQHLRLGPKMRTGVTCEWADPAWGSKPASVDNVIQDGEIASSYVGVYMDNGTTRTTAQRLKFIGQSHAGIVDNLGVGNAYPNNDYTALPAGVPQVAPAG